MPSFDRDALRKGSKAIDEALESRKQGDFRPFLPNIYWKDDKEFRYLMFLNPLEEIPEVDFHPYIDCDDGVPHMAIARTDRSIGDTKDPIHQQWGYKPKLTCLALAVELEPVTKVVGGRTKPVGFEVQVRTFERKIRDDDNNDTGEVEEVTVPVVGLVAQSPFNFFNQLREFDTSEAAVHTTPVKITRLGKKDNVTYNVVGYDMIEPDLTNLLEYVENLSYVTDPETLLEAIAEAGDDTEAATVAIGDYLLYRRIEELADEETYNGILGEITKEAKFSDKKDDKKSTRQARPSQRRTEAEEAPEETEEAEEAPKARTRKAKAKVSSASPADARLAELRERGSVKAAA